MAFLWNEREDVLLNCADVNFETSTLTLNEETTTLASLNDDVMGVFDLSDNVYCNGDLDFHVFPDECFTQDSLQNELSDSSDSGIGSSGIHEGNWRPCEGLNTKPPSSPDLCSSDLVSVKSSPQHIKQELSIQPQSQFSQPNQNNQPYHTIVIPQKAININSIMDSKVKIKPKPIVQNGSSMFIKVESQNGQIINEGPIPQDQFGALLNPMSHVQMNNEFKSTKRQQRMIKNRESACLSRKRKREYLSQLEDQLRECSSQNEKLRVENDLLKERIRVFEAENSNLKRTVCLSPAKKVCLMGVFMILCVNVFSGKLSLIQNGQPGGNDEKIPTYKGRQLLSYPEGAKNNLKSFASKGDRQKLKQLFHDQVEFARNKSEINCATYLNHTESVKLAEELSGWMKRFKLEKRKSSKKTVRKARKFSRTNYFSSFRGQIQKLSTKYFANHYQIQPLNYTHKEEFWNGISRRNDTFYILSFNTDYYLVPATLHNGTERPRMSLFMPGLTRNDTHVGKIGMIQIDCEVLKTKFVDVQKSMIPTQELHKNMPYFTSYDGI
ncbi:cyclic AMP-dependent transcription factor ATF-6 alpha-like [Ostrea edulis]|uniref:cyclic AMP-dependent transcription factor ATF-6 alpha-like n=1 Tax=Ostrea edulis TaxID=37623 RepID=UPI0024AFE8D2|nr:cyclic AMP-dependent transcription factor ATF-6 alpha-like [Ostrea edulis]